MPSAGPTGAGEMSRVETKPREKENRAHENERENEDARPDLETSHAPGGAGQIEQEPARGRRIIADAEHRPDADIGKDLEAQLSQADDIDASRLQCIVSDGVVTLLGTVADYAIKRHVEQICEHTRGVREIHDGLLVEHQDPYAGAGGLRTTDPGSPHK